MEKTVKPYSESGSKKTQVANMFDNIARRYDFLNRLLSLGIDKIWRKKAIDQLKKLQPKYILDVATGTADVALETARRLHPDKSIGLDISAEMLHFGREKVAKQGLAEVIELVQGDSENLSFSDNTFDAITVAFGVRNFENLEKGLSEMNRVLKPGGKLVVLEFSKPRLFPFKQLFQFYFQNILPIIGRWTSQDPRAYKYLFESVQVFPEGEQFLNILQKTGYKSSKCIPLTLGVCSIYTAEK
ncbi:MAG: bifunctional demethylmenaquinone methyltransferase/2-methoxy-6-polyprenyl-1,4-benzoquinol methylase UbiE [Saprospiraceae bacterium]